MDLDRWIGSSEQTMQASLSVELFELTLGLFREFCPNGGWIDSSLSQHLRSHTLDGE